MTCGSCGRVHRPETSRLCWRVKTHFQASIGGLWNVADPLDDRGRAVKERPYSWWLVPVGNRREAWQNAECRWQNADLRCLLCGSSLLTVSYITIWLHHVAAGLIKDLSMCPWPPQPHMLLLTLWNLFVFLACSLPRDLIGWGSKLEIAYCTFHSILFSCVRLISSPSMTV